MNATGHPHPLVCPYCGLVADWYTLRMPIIEAGDRLAAHVAFAHSEPRPDLARDFALWAAEMASAVPMRAEEL